MSVNFTRADIKEQNSRQLYSLERQLHQGLFNLESVGDQLPGNVLVTDLNSLSTLYMNQSGCNILNHSVGELEELGPEYFQRFFVPDEMNVFVNRYLKMKDQQDPHEVYNFAHRVKASKTDDYSWYFASAKLMFDSGKGVADKMLVIVNEVNSAGYMARKINTVLDETEAIKKQFKKFCLLTKKEKEVIGLITSGHTGPEAADILGVSKYTIHTHRRNIAVKLELKNFAALYRFAETFGLIHP